MDPSFIAYGAIVTMALCPIYFGSWQSIDRVLPTSVSEKLTLSSRLGTRIDTEVFSTSEAYMFPVTGSAALLTLYLIFRYIGKDYINMLVAAYFAIIGVWVLTVLFAQLVSPVETYFGLDKFEISIKKELKELDTSAVKNVSVDKSKQSEAEVDAEADTEETDDGTLLSIPFTSLSFCSFLASIAIAVLYTVTKNWLLSNFFGLAFSMIGIRIMTLDSFKTGMILLSGLFFYDIFWVFGTNVMVDVAVKLDAPIKLLFPRDIWAEKFNFAMLGLGDIVIPGVFIALCLRWDYHRYLLSLGKKAQKFTKTSAKGGSSSPVSGAAKKNLIAPASLVSMSFPKPYFNSCLLAYIGGLLLTIFVMHVFKTAQPALLYLSPACILSTLAVAISYGHVAEIFAYSSESDSKLKNSLVPDGKTPKVASPPALGAAAVAKVTEKSIAKASAGEQIVEFSTPSALSGSPKIVSSQLGSRPQKQKPISKTNGRSPSPQRGASPYQENGSSVAPRNTKPAKKASSLPFAEIIGGIAKNKAHEEEELPSGSEAVDDDMMIVVSRKSRKRRAAGKMAA